MSQTSKPSESNMTIKQMKMSVGDHFPDEISSEQAHALGIVEWRLSDTAIKEIEAIESNIRLAESQSGKILVC
jgi:hypothetical protein